MQAIFDVLKSIGEFFSNVIDFVVTLFQDIVYVVKIIGATIAKIPDYLSFLPPAVLAAFVGALAIIVVYKIAGRD